MGERTLFFRGMTTWLEFKRVLIPFSVSRRIDGKSRWSTLKLIRLAVNGVTAYTSIPLHFITLAGAVFLLFAIILGIQTLIMKITGIAVEGFTTVIILQLLIGSSLMIGLGIIGEYIARIYNETKGRPRYVVDEITGKINNQEEY